METKLRTVSTSMLIFFVVFLSLVYLRHNFWYYLDDSFITFRYAQNFAEGHGLRFNIGETHFGSTAMGMALLLGVLSWIADTIFYHAVLIKGLIVTEGGLIPLIASILCAASIGLTVTLTFMAGRKTVGDIGAWLVTTPFALILASTKYMQLSGHETSIFLSLLVLGLYLAFFLCSPTMAGIVLAFATIIRPDSLLMFIILLSLIAARALVTREQKGSITELVKILIGYAAIYLPWLLFCRLYFGQALPETLLAKRAQVILGDWTRYNTGLALEVAIDSIGKSLSVFIGLLILSSVGLSIAWVKQSRNLFHLPALAMVVALLLFGFGQSLFYSLIGVTFWPWYVTPLIFVWIVSGAFAGILLFRFLSFGGWIGKSSALVIIMSIGPAAFAFPAVLHNVKTVFKIESVNQHVFSYDPIVKYLHEQNPEGCCVATPEPGALGFKLGTRYKVVDELGLASPDVAKHIIEGDMDYAFNRWHPDYVIVTWPGKYNPQDRPWFAKSYALVNEFPHEYWQENLKRGALLYKHKNTPGS